MSNGYAEYIRWLEIVATAQFPIAHKVNLSRLRITRTSWSEFRLFLIAFVSLLDEHGEAPFCTPSVASLLNIHPSKVQRGLSAAIGLGLLEITYDGGRFEPTVYRICLPGG